MGLGAPRSPLPHLPLFQAGELLTSPFSKSSPEGWRRPALHSWGCATAVPYQSRCQPPCFSSSWGSRRKRRSTHPSTGRVIPCGHAPPGASSSGNSVHSLSSGRGGSATVRLVALLAWRRAACFLAIRAVRWLRGQHAAVRCLPAMPGQSRVLAPLLEVARAARVGAADEPAAVLADRRQSLLALRGSCERDTAFASGIPVLGEM